MNSPGCYFGGHLASVLLCIEAGSTGSAWKNPDVDEDATRGGGDIFLNCYKTRFLSRDTKNEDFDEEE